MKNAYVMAKKSLKALAKKRGIVIRGQPLWRLVELLKARGYDVANNPDISKLLTSGSAGQRTLIRRAIDGSLAPKASKNSKPKMATQSPSCPARERTEASIRDFYASWEWKRLSYETRRARGQRCECCGATPERHGVRIVADHIKPIRRFWASRLDPANIQVLCDDCNRGKGSHDETDWRYPESLIPHAALEYLDEAFARAMA